ncbi:MAG: hypothetical protein LBU58_10330, partial [Clostridiales bacterium]|nr:hypothetical protein [Clostridiales bacterium]
MVSIKRILRTALLCLAVLMSLLLSACGGSGASTALLSTQTAPTTMAQTASASSPAQTTATETPPSQASV